MILHLTDGTTREVPFRAGYAGYCVEKVELDAADLAAMRRLAWKGPVLFNVIMRQLEARFRHGGDVIEVSDYKTEVADA